MDEKKSGINIRDAVATLCTKFNDEVAAWKDALRGTSDIPTGERDSPFFPAGRRQPKIAIFHNNSNNYAPFHQDPNKEDPMAVVRTHKFQFFKR